VVSEDNLNFKKSYAWTHFNMEINGYEDVSSKKGTCMMWSEKAD
jgi:hypothetical protein